MPTKEDVVDLFDSFYVRIHMASSLRGPRRYAVYGPEGQVTEPTTHKDASIMLRLILAQEILDLFAGEN